MRREAHEKYEASERRIERKALMQDKSQIAFVTEVRCQSWYEFRGNVGTDGLWRTMPMSAVWVLYFSFQNVNSEANCITCNYVVENSADWRIEMRRAW